MITPTIPTTTPAPSNAQFAKPADTNFEAYENSQGFPQGKPPTDPTQITPNQNNGSISPTPAQSGNDSPQAGQPSQSTISTPSASPYGANANGVPYGSQNSNNPNPNSGVYTSLNQNTPSTTGNSNTDALVKAQNDLATAATTFSNTITGIGNGSVPLSAGDQAQIQGLQGQFAQLIQQQQLQNTGATGTANVRGYQTGAAEYDPNFQNNTINSVVTAGANKILQLQIQEAQAIAGLTTSLKNNEIATAKSAFDAYQTANTATQTALKTTIADTQSAINDAHIASVLSAGVTDPKDIIAKLQSQGYTDISSDDISKAIKNLSPDASNIYDIQKTAAANGATPDILSAIGKSPDVTSALSAAKDYLQTATGDMATYLNYKRTAETNGQIPEDYNTWETANTKQQDKEKASSAYATAFATASGKADAEAKYQTSQPSTPVVSSVGATSGLTFNAPADIAPYVSFSNNGVKYVDLSAFAGTPTEKNQAVNDAYAAGYKVITYKNTALDVQNITDAMSKLGDIKTAFDGITTDSAAARDSYYSAAITLAKELQTNPDAAASGVYQDAALDVLKALSGTQGFRGGTSMVAAVQNTFPQNTDTTAVADQKIANIQKLITDRENALVGQPSAADQLLIDSQQAKGAVDNFVTSNPSQAEFIAKLYEVPGANDSTVYEYLQASGKL